MTLSPILRVLSIFRKQKVKALLIGGQASKIRWWLMESRTPETLARLCAERPAAARNVMAQRPLLREAVKSNLKRLSVLLKKEEAAERAKDSAYWSPLKKELEKLRLSRER